MIVEACEGDLRKVNLYFVLSYKKKHSLFVLQAITLLQSAHRLRGDEEITQDDILEIAGVRST